MVKQLACEIENGLTSLTILNQGSGHTGCRNGLAEIARRNLVNDCAQEDDATGVAHNVWLYPSGSRDHAQLEVQDQM
jgi:hypothetical protein